MRHAKIIEDFKRFVSSVFYRSRTEKNAIYSIFMKIAMFTDAYFPRINGVSVSVRSYATEVSKLGHEVWVVCPEYTEEQQKSALFDEKSNDGESPFKVMRIPSTRIIFSREDRMGRIDMWHRIKREMDLFRPDVIHVNSEWTVGYFGEMYAHHRKIACVFTFHTMWEDYLENYVPILPAHSLRKIGRSVVRFFLKRADVIVAPTKRIENVARNYGVQNTVHVIPTGIPDGAPFSFQRSIQVSSRLFKKYPHLKGKRILLFVGRIVKEKNLPFLFDVLEIVIKKLPKTALLFVGGGPFLEELSQIASSRGLSQYVAFPGYMKSEDLIYFYKLASVFVFPSKTETQGLVTLEAMVASLPVVAIGELGTVDVMQGDHGGFMVKDDVNEFSEKVLQLLNDQNLRKRKSKEAAEWGGKWRISALTPLLLSCYEEAIKSKIPAEAAEAGYDEFENEFNAELGLESSNGI